MKISEKQLLFLFHLLTDTLTKNVLGYLSTTHEDRNRMLNEIINQQDEKLFDVKKSDKNIKQQEDKN